MTEKQIKAVASAIDSVQLFSRYNDWTSDHVPGLPIEICRAGTDYEDEVVVISRHRADVGETDALASEVSRARAIAAINAMSALRETK